MVILMIRGREKVILLNGGRKKVIWAGDRRKVNEAGGCGLRKSNTRIFLSACSSMHKLSFFLS